MEGGPQARESRQPLEARKDEDLDSAMVPPEEITALQHLHLKISDIQNCKRIILCVLL